MDTRDQRSRCDWGLTARARWFVHQSAWRHALRRPGPLHREARAATVLAISLQLSPDVHLAGPALRLAVCPAAELLELRAQVFARDIVRRHGDHDVTAL